ncbi:hypothetical protein TRICHSKD4_5925 [Roseibium sp. TrichSKD4]|nr:hypothetical protein TRICHSKD4_5925 [Roseibium sp. TrichSKD4]
MPKAYQRRSIRLFRLFWSSTHRRASSRHLLSSDGARSAGEA